MSSLLDKARQKSERDRKIIALTTSGILVGVIFAVWATTLVSRLNAGPIDKPISESVEETQTASAFESIKRKAALLFGEGSPLREFDIFQKEIEYKREETISGEDGGRNLDALLKEFNETRTTSTATISETGETNYSF